MCLAWVSFMYVSLPTSEQVFIPYLVEVKCMFFSFLKNQSFLGKMYMYNFALSFKASSLGLGLPAVCLK